MEYQFFDRTQDGVRQTRSAFVSVNARRGYINFSYTAIQELRVAPSDRILIGKAGSGKSWVVVKTKRQEGYKLSGRPRTLKASCKYRVEEMRISMGFKATKVFYLQATEDLHENQTIFELLPINDHR